MNKRIKFRAWDKEAKKMLYYDTDVVPSMTLNGVLVNEVGSNVSYLFELMQFTGLSDKNGKDIYCGDILETFAILASNKIDSKPFNVEVKWNESGWIANGSLTNYQCRISSIIGNIYENKDLL